VSLNACCGLVDVRSDWVRVNVRVILPFVGSFCKLV